MRGSCRITTWQACSWKILARTNTTGSEQKGDVTVIPRCREFAGFVALTSIFVLLLSCRHTPRATSEDPACAGAKVPSPTSAAPDTTLNDMFNSYADQSTTQDWSGADGGRSIGLPDGRILWTYGDSFLGPVHADHTRPTDAKLVTNTFIVQDGNHLSTIFTHSTPPGAAIPVPGQDPHERWYWPGAGTVGNGAVEIILSQVRRGKAEEFGFIGEKQSLARLSLPDLRLISVTDLPSRVPRLNWGADILHDGDYTYIYGVQETDSGKNMHIARVRDASLAGAWEYFTGGGWSEAASDSKPVLKDVGAAYGVTKIGRFYTVIMVVPFDPEVYAYFSCTPTGPFTNKTLVYRTPESGKNGIYHRADLYTYNIDVHDQLGAPNKVVITYNVNGKNFFDTFKNASLYRPRYLDVTFNTP